MTTTPPTAAGRFEAMLATAMRLGEVPGASDIALSAEWRQIVDIVAQAGDALGDDGLALAFDRLTHARVKIPVAQRRLAAASLAGRTRSVRLVALFATDTPGVAAPFLARAVLDDAGWLTVLPAMPPASRNILRNRRDLPPAATDLLARLAPGDLALPSATVEPAEPATVVEAPANPGITQIRDLVDRIAAFRARTPPTPAKARASGRIDGFSFEAGLAGTIEWVEGAPREALIGLSIAQVAEAGEAGVDGGAAGAWRRRAPIADARLMVAGSGPAGGDWLISATPMFNPRDGRFLGFRGSARRPHAGERAAVASERMVGIAPDLLRQLVHELRTPLNAVHGFAEMIDRQLLGPAAYHYRERARAIMVEAERLVTMIDDLDTAARLDAGRPSDWAPPAPSSAGDVAPLVLGLVAAHRPALAARGVSLVADVAQAETVVERVQVERIGARLLAAATGVAAAGETIRVTLVADHGRARYAVSRPAVLAGRDDRTLLDPEYGPEGDWPDAPLLGLGFTLRLVTKLAAQVGGALAILPDRFEVMFPGEHETSATKGAVVGPAGFEPAT